MSKTQARGPNAWVNAGGPSRETHGRAGYHGAQGSGPKVGGSKAQGPRSRVFGPWSIVGGQGRAQGSWWVPKARGRRLNAKDWGPKAQSHGPKAQGWGLMITFSLGPKATGRGPRPKAGGLMLGVQGPRPGTKSPKPYAQGLGHKSVDPRLGAQAQRRDPRPKAEG